MLGNKGFFFPGPTEIRSQVRYLSFSDRGHLWGGGIRGEEVALITNARGNTSHLSRGRDSGLREEGSLRSLSRSISP